MVLLPAIIKNDYEGKEILKEIIEWLNNDTSYLSTRTDYAKGYKNGIICAKEIIESIIKNHNPELLKF